MVFTFGYLSLLFSSALIVLRISALWEHNKFIVAIASTAWLANTVFFVYSAAISKGYWNGRFCSIHHTVHNRIGILSTCITDLVLLSLMLFGSLRWKNARRSGGIAQLLYKQTLAWGVIFALAEFPPLVIIILNLDDPMNLMFMDFGVITMSCGAARMHRTLVEYSMGNMTSMKATGAQERLGETPSRPATPPHPKSLTEGTQGVEDTLPSLNSLPHSSPQDWSRTPPDDRTWGSGGDIA
ncbi:hypothetical protein BJV74DRAFT_860292 [Russula compacta]|nr:hypothetical protein BJV74DRAFT_860292 [Russula compacta]